MPPDTPARQSTPPPTLQPQLPLSCCPKSKDKKKLRVFVLLRRLWLVILMLILDNTSETSAVRGCGVDGGVYMGCPEPWMAEFKRVRDDLEASPYRRTHLPHILLQTLAERAKFSFNLELLQCPTSYKFESMKYCEVP